MNKIQLPIEMFSKGSVIFIDFVYDDKPEKSKERPAIVTDYNEEETRVVLLKVTSRETRSKYDYLISNPEIADLKAGSVVLHQLVFLAALWTVQRIIDESSAFLYFGTRLEKQNYIISFLNCYT